MVTVLRRFVVAMLSAFTVMATLSACSSASLEVPPAEQAQIPSHWAASGSREEADPMKDEICDEADLGPGECPD